MNSANYWCYFSFLFSPPSTPHTARMACFISYAWGTMDASGMRPLQVKARSVVDSVLAASPSYSVWMDIEKMAADSCNKGMVGAMVDAIDQAQLVIVCISQEYQDSDNCMKEYTYAYKVRKPLVYVNVGAPGFTPSRNLLFRMGEALWANAWTPDWWNSDGGEKILLAQIGRVCAGEALAVRRGDERPASFFLKKMQEVHLTWNRLPSIFDAGVTLAADLPVVELELLRRVGPQSAAVGGGAVLREPFEAQRLSDGCHHVVTGAAGGGKTTLLRQLAYRAAAAPPGGRQFVMLRLRDLGLLAPTAWTQCSTAGEAVAWVVANSYRLSDKPDPSELPGLAEGLFGVAERTNTVWLLDGFDELPCAAALATALGGAQRLPPEAAAQLTDGNTAAAVESLLRLLLGQPRVVVTTRPQFAEALDARVELQPMAQSAMEQYLSSRTNAEAPGAQSLLSRAHENPSLLRALRIPVVLQLALGVETVRADDLAEGVGVGEVSRIYVRVARALQRHLCEQLVSVHHLTQDEAEVRIGVCTQVLRRLALDACAQDAVPLLPWVGSEQELEDLRLGRLVDVVDCGAGPLVEFAHRSLQEFFASQELLNKFAASSVIDRAIFAAGNDQLRRFTFALAPIASTAGAIARAIWTPKEGFDSSDLALLAVALEDCPYLPALGVKKGIVIGPFCNAAISIADEVVRRFKLIDAGNCPSKCKHHEEGKGHLLAVNEGPFWTLANALSGGELENRAIKILEAYASSWLPYTRQARCAVDILTFVSSRLPRAKEALMRLCGYRVFPSHHNNVRISAIVSLGLLFSSSAGNDISALAAIAKDSNLDGPSRGLAISWLLARHSEEPKAHYSAWEAAASPDAPYEVVDALISFGHWLEREPPVGVAGAEALLKRVAAHHSTLPFFRAISELQLVLGLNTSQGSASDVMAEFRKAEAVVDLSDKALIRLAYAAIHGPLSSRNLYHITETVIVVDCVHFFADYLRRLCTLGLFLSHKDFFSEACSFIVHALADSRPGVAEATANCLETLVKDARSTAGMSPRMRDAFSALLSHFDEKGALPAIVIMLRTYSSAEKLPQSACNALVSIAGTSHGGWEDCVSLGAVPVLVTLLHAYGGVPDLLESVCWMLWNIAAMPSGKNACISGGVFPAISAILCNAAAAGRIPTSVAMWHVAAMNEPAFSSITPPDLADLHVVYFEEHLAQMEAVVTSAISAGLSVNIWAHPRELELSSIQLDWQSNMVLGLRHAKIVVLCLGFDFYERCKLALTECKSRHLHESNLDLMIAVNCEASYVPDENVLSATASSIIYSMRDISLVEEHFLRTKNMDNLSAAYLRNSSYLPRVRNLLNT